MTKQAANYERLKSLYRAGHALPHLADHIQYRIDLNDLLGSVDRLKLLAVLEDSIRTIRRQIVDTGSPWGPTVPVCEMVGSVLHIRAAIVDLPPSAAEGDEPSAPPDTPPTPPQRPPSPQTLLADPGDSSGDASGQLPGPPAPPNVGSEVGQTAAQQQEEFEAAAWRARDILLMHKNGKIKSFEALMGEIQAGPLTAKIMHWLLTVVPNWQPWETKRGMLDWAGLKRIDGYFPSESPAVLDAQVFKIDPTNRTASLQLKRLYTKAHTATMAKFGTPRRPYIPVSIATSELADILAFYRGVGLPVRLSLTVHHSLATTKKPALTVALTCPVENSVEAIKAAVDAKLKFVLKRPEQLGLWDQPEVT